MIRVGCYIDGFNLYHSIDDLSRASRGRLNYLKWLDIAALTRVFIDPNVHRIETIKYFSTYPTWKPMQLQRHQLYVRALQESAVTVILGQFKEKDVRCKNCKTTYKAHEEKESDVNLATHLMNDAHLGVFDQAFIITQDSDLSAPIRLVIQEFPKKKIKVIAPPGRHHSKELGALAHSRAAIREEHLSRCQFPKEIRDKAGAVIVTRPVEYDPPS